MRAAGPPLAGTEGFRDKLAVPWFLLTHGFQYFASLTVTPVELFFLFILHIWKGKKGFPLRSGHPGEVVVIISTSDTCHSSESPFFSLKLQLSAHQSLPTTAQGG